MTRTTSYKLETLVWELTMGCNLRCKHCGSSCLERLEGELSETEAMEVVEQIAELHPRWISLTGGEPLLRNDWDSITKKLKQLNIGVRMITNGTLLDEAVAVRMKSCGLDLVSISIDGTEAIHDRIRGKGVYQKAEAAICNLKASGIAAGVNTTVMKENLDNLEELCERLIGLGVSDWQIQPGLPEGNMVHSPNNVPDVNDLKQLIDFSYQKNNEGKIRVHLAETIGYYTRMETLSRMLALNTETPVIWKGCNAGIRSLGILHNGDVTGCTSMRSRIFVEGNLRRRKLKEIWNNQQSFAWRRNMDSSNLGENCRNCEYSSICLGGCSNVRFIMNGDVKSDNPLCIYLSSKNPQQNI